MADKPMLKLFKEQLGNQIPAIRKSLGLDTDGEAFGYWFFKNILVETDQSSKDQICEGGGDLGIDAITVSEDEVVFYQFKNPQDSVKGIETGEVDKMLSGLALIIAQNYKEIANPELQARVQEIYSVTPSRYVISIVTSGDGIIQNDARTKLDSFCIQHGGVSKKLFSWTYKKLDDIHDLFYASNLPTLTEDVQLKIGQPFLEKIGSHEVYLFSLP